MATPRQNAISYFSGYNPANFTAFGENQAVAQNTYDLSQALKSAYTSGDVNAIKTASDAFRTGLAPYLSNRDLISRNRDLSNYIYGARYTYQDLEQQRRNALLSAARTAGQTRFTDPLTGKTMGVSGNANYGALGSAEIASYFDNLRSTALAQHRAERAIDYNTQAGLPAGATSSNIQVSPAQVAALQATGTPVPSYATAALAGQNVPGVSVAQTPAVTPPVNTTTSVQEGDYVPGRGVLQPDGSYSGGPVSGTQTSNIVDAASGSKPKQIGGTYTDSVSGGKTYFTKDAQNNVSYWDAAQNKWLPLTEQMFKSQWQPLGLNLDVIPNVGTAINPVTGQQLAGPGSTGQQPVLNTDATGFPMPGQAGTDATWFKAASDWVRNKYGAAGNTQLSLSGQYYKVGNDVFRASDGVKIGPVDFFKLGLNMDLLQSRASAPTSTPTNPQIPGGADVGTGNPPPNTGTQIDFDNYIEITRNDPNTYTSADAIARYGPGGNQELSKSGRYYKVGNDIYDSQQKDADGGDHKLNQDEFHYLGLNYSLLGSKTSRGMGTTTPGGGEDPLPDYTSEDPIENDKLLDLRNELEIFQEEDPFYSRTIADFRRGKERELGRGDLLDERNGIQNQLNNLLYGYERLSATVKNDPNLSRTLINTRLNYISDKQKAEAAVMQRQLDLVQKRLEDVDKQVTTYIQDKLDQYKIYSDRRKILQDEIDKLEARDDALADDARAAMNTLIANPELIGNISNNEVEFIRRNGYYPVSLLKKIGSSAGLTDSVESIYQVDNGSTRDTYAVTRNKTTGKLTVTKLASNPQQNNSDGTNPGEIPGTVYADTTRILGNTRGQDGYVDTRTYIDMANYWQSQGYSVKEFVDSYPPKQFLNPADPITAQNANWLNNYLGADNQIIPSVAH